MTEKLKALDEACNAGLEAAARKLEDWARPSQLQLHAGEMTAQEKRTTIAVLKGVTAAIRAMKKTP